MLRGQLSQSLHSVTGIPDGTHPSQELVQLKSEAALIAQKALTGALPYELNQILTKLDGLATA